MDVDQLQQEYDSLLHTYERLIALLDEDMATPGQPQLCLNKFQLLRDYLDAERQSVVLQYGPAFGHPA